MNLITKIIVYNSKKLLRIFKNCIINKKLSVSLNSLYFLNRNNQYFDIVFFLFFFNKLHIIYPFLKLHFTIKKNLLMKIFILFKENHQTRLSLILGLIILFTFNFYFLAKFFLLIWYILLLNFFKNKLANFTLFTS